jgi:hypothetical protein
MANYSDIKGFTVQTVSSDPAASTAATGSWASGGTINNARDLLGGAGPQTSALIFGGQPYPGSSAYTESYDGSSWTEVADLNTARMEILVHLIIEQTLNLGMAVHGLRLMI